MTTRIYSVALKMGDGMRLVRAGNQSQALRHVAKQFMETRVATQDDIVAAVTAGAKVEDASAEDDAK